MTPLSPRSGGAALFWVIAVACLLAAAAALSARLADRAAFSADTALRSALTARILAPEGEDALNQAAAALSAASGVQRVRVLAPERAAAILRASGGPAIDVKDLPTLRLIQFRADQPPTADWMKYVERTLAASGFTAEIYGPGPALKNAAEDAQIFAAAALIISAALALAALMTAGLAGRARVSADRHQIAPLADMGATRGQVAGAFAARAAGEGFMAGLVGAFFAALLSAAILTMGQPNVPLVAWAQQLDLADGAALVVVPILAALLAAAGARTASNRFYREAARRA